MTNQPKPCLPGCRCTCGDLWENHNPRDLDLWIAESHAPACKNAKPAEPPKPAPEAAKALTPPEWEEANHEQDAPCPMCGAPDGMRLRAGHGYESCDCIKCGGTLGNYSEGMLIDLIVREWFQSLKPAPAPAEKGEVDWEAADRAASDLEIAKIGAWNCDCSTKGPNHPWQCLMVFGPRLEVRIEQDRATIATQAEENKTLRHALTRLSCHPCRYQGAGGWKKCHGKPDEMCDMCCARAALSPEPGR